MGTVVTYMTQADEHRESLIQGASNTNSMSKIEESSFGGLPKDEEDDGCGSCVGGVIWFLSMILIICTFPFSLCFTVKMVQEYERAVIFRLGRVKRGGAVGPGLFFIIPCKDSITVAVDAVVYYKINNPMFSVINVTNAASSTRLLASTTLRTTLGTKTLQEILADREHTAEVILEQLDTATDPWGIKVERVEVKDVRLPQQLQRAMAAEAEAAREARAKVIAAE